MSKEKARQDLYPEHKMILCSQRALLSILSVGLNTIPAENENVVVKAQGIAVGGCGQLGAMPLLLSKSETLIRSPIAGYSGMGRVEYSVL